MVARNTGRDGMVVKAMSSASSSYHPWLWQGIIRDQTVEEEKILCRADRLQRGQRYKSHMGVLSDPDSRVQSNLD